MNISFRGGALISASLLECDFDEIRYEIGAMTQ